MFECIKCNVDHTTNEMELIDLLKNMHFLNVVRHQ